MRTFNGLNTRSIVLAAALALGLHGFAQAQTPGAPPANPFTASFKASDKDKDGKLTKAEFQEFSKAIGMFGETDAMWTKLDANKDNFVTEAEFSNALGGAAVKRPIKLPAGEAVEPLSII